MLGDDNIISGIASGAVTAITVQTITGDINEAGIAAAYGAWISSITGTTPQVYNMGNGQTKIVFDENEKAALTAWLDSNLHGLMSASAIPDKVDYGLDAVMVPWALKYTVPIIVGAFIAGWFMHYVFGRNR
jgi:hypothetical protein